MHERPAEDNSDLWVNVRKGLVGVTVVSVTVAFLTGNYSLGGSILGAFASCCIGKCCFNCCKESAHPLPEIVIGGCHTTIAVTRGPQAV